MESGRLAICVVVVLGVLSANSNASAQTGQSLFVDQYSRGDEVTIQGCVKVIPDRQSVFLTQIMTWPILRITSTFGPYHFWTTDHVRELSEHIGDTVQMKGRIDSVLRVLQGCLSAPRAATSARRQR